MIAQHMYMEPPPFREANSSVTIPARLEEEVMRMLSKLPSQRPSARTVATFLQQFDESKPQRMGVGRQGAQGREARMVSEAPVRPANNFVNEVGRASVLVIGDLDADTETALSAAGLRCHRSFADETSSNSDVKFDAVLALGAEASTVAPYNASGLPVFSDTGRGRHGTNHSFATRWCPRRCHTSDRRGTPRIQDRACDPENVMKQTTLFFLTFALGAANLWAPQSIRAQQNGSPASTTLSPYVVQEGDTCGSVAKKVFGNRKRWDLIHKYNRLGKLPHVLKAGQVLQLPSTDEESADATVTKVIRRVDARSPAAKSWEQVQSGHPLYSGWRVSTRDEASAEVTFRDTSKIYLREKTLVIIYGGSGSLSRRGGTKATLDSGSLRSSLGELRMAVQMPNAETNLRGGSAVVSVDGEGTSRLSNHEGAATLRGRSGRVRAVEPGFGSKVEKGGAAMKPKPLPPAPRWHLARASIVALGDVGGSIRGSWNAIASARSYRVEVYDSTRNALVAAAEVPSAVTKFEFHRLPPGTYRASVATIDMDFFEGKPSHPMNIDVVAVDVPGARFAPNDNPLSDPGAPTLDLGASVRTTAGVTCMPSVFRSIGKREIRCGRVGGGARIALEVQVDATSISRRRPNRRFSRGETTWVEYEITGHLPEDVGPVATRGLRILTQDRTTKAVRVQIRVGASATKIEHIRWMRPVDYPKQSPVEYGNGILQLR